MRAMWLLIVGVPLAACTGARPPLEPTPPSLVHVGDVQVRAAMWRLARDTGALREILQTSSEPQAEVQAAARGLLDDITQTVVRLQSDPLTSPHPLLNTGLPGFAADVRQARAAIDREPPDYEPALRLSRSCLQCHAVAAVTERADQRHALR